MSSSLESGNVPSDELVYLSRHSEVRRIVTYKLVAERVENDILSVEEARHAIQALVRQEELLIETRFIMEVDAPNARYLVDTSAVFELESTVDFTATLVSDFISEIAIMVVYPYLREAISGLAARLGAEVPFLGVLRRGDFKIGMTRVGESESDE